MKKTTAEIVVGAPLAAVATCGLLAAAPATSWAGMMLAACGVATTGTVATWTGVAFAIGAAIGWLLVLDFMSNSPVLHTVADLRRNRRRPAPKFGGGRGLGIMDNL